MPANLVKKLSVRQVAIHIVENPFAMFVLMVVTTPRTGLLAAQFAPLAIIVKRVLKPFAREALTIQDLAQKN